MNADAINQAMEKEFEGYESEFPSYQELTEEYSFFPLTRRQHSFSHFACYAKKTGDKVKVKIYPCAIEKNGKIYVSYPRSKDRKDFTYSLGKMPKVEDPTVILVEKEHEQEPIVKEFSL